MSVEYEQKMSLKPEHRDTIKEIVRRANVSLPQGLTAAKFFHHATVEFLIQTGREHATGDVLPRHTICILENKGRRAVGVATLGNDPINFDAILTGERKFGKMYLEGWKDDTGQNIALTRAVRQYLTDTHLPIRVGDETNEFRVVRTQDAVDLLLVDTMPTPAIHDEEITVSSIDVDSMNVIGWVAKIGSD